MMFLAFRLIPRLTFSAHRTRRMSALKTIAYPDDLKDGEMKSVDFDDGKVLLSKLGGTVHATSAFCTHYGAPLASGVLTADGRVVCPWHGACFNVCTGDIEDAPAPSALHSFKTSISDGKVHVTADPTRTTKSNFSRTPKFASTSAKATTEGNGTVIVGGGSGAFQTIESLREHGYQGSILVLSKENHAPIDRTKLSKALITDPAKIELRSAADLKIKFGATLRTGVTVTGVDVKAKKVTLDGKEEIPYEKLVLAPGGTPRRLPIEGANLENVFTLRGIEDSKKVDELAKEGKRMVVIGSSFISMEVVAAVAKRKLDSINVIGRDDFPFQAVLGKEVGAGLMKYHESQGVKFHMKSGVDRIVLQEGSTTLAGGVVVNGETLPADLVIMGVGVSPATEFLKSETSPGFPELQEDGGVKVDEFLKVEGVEDVYAIGDIAFYPQLATGESRRVEHWNVAGNQGRAVGKTISGGEPQPFVKVPIFWSAQGQQLRYCGVGAGYDDVYVNGDPGALKFVAYYGKAGKVVAVGSMQRDPIVSKASELLRLGLMPTLEELRGGKDILTIDIATESSLGRVKSA